MYKHKPLIIRINRVQNCLLGTWSSKCQQPRGPGDVTLEGHSDDTSAMVVPTPPLQNLSKSLLKNPKQKPQ